MTIQTLRPNSDDAVSGWTRNGGGTPLWTQIDDAPVDDATYAVANAGSWPGSYYITGLTSYTLAAAERCKQVQIRWRHASESAGVGRAVWMTIRDPQGSSSGGPAVSSPRDFAQGSSTTFGPHSGMFRPQAPGVASGGVWTQAVLSRMQVEMYAKQAASLRISEVYVDLDINAQPVTSAVTQTGHTTTTRPTVSWAYSDADNDAQTVYRVKVFSAAQYGAGGFDPETAAATWDSGELFGNAGQAVVGADLVNGVTYKAYVKTGQAWPTGVPWYSAWALSAAFTMSLVPPPTPRLSVTSDSAVPAVRNLLQVLADLNVLTADQSSSEVAVGSWPGLVNMAAPTRTTAQAKSGVASTLMSSSAAGTMSMTTASGTSGFPVRPGDQWTASCSFRAAVSARTCKVYLVWYKRDGTASATPTSGSAGAADSTGAWVTQTVTATVPADAQFAAVRCEVAATGAGAEVHYADETGAWTGPGTAWTPGGWAGTDTQEAQYADLTAGTSNLAPSQLASGTELTKGADGFYPRTADRVTSDLSASHSGERSLLWETLVGTFGFLDWGLPNGTFDDLAPPYALACVPGRTYTLSVWAKASASFSSKLFVFTRDHLGNQVDAGANTGAVTITTAWQQFSVTKTVPAGTVWCSGGLENTAGAENVKVWADDITWKEGSAAGAAGPGQGIGLYFSPWAALRGSPLAADAATQKALVYDEEAPPARIRIYRARNVAVQPDEVTVLASPWSAPVPAQLDAPGQWVLKDPLQPANNLAADILQGLTEEVGEDLAEEHPLGRELPAVFSDFIGGYDGAFQVHAKDDAAWYGVQQLLRTRHALWLAHPAGGAKYVRLVRRSISKPLVGAGTTLTVDYVETGRPA